VSVRLLTTIQLFSLTVGFSIDSLFLFLCNHSVANFCVSPLKNGIVVERCIVEQSAEY